MMTCTFFSSSKAASRVGLTIPGFFFLAKSVSGPEHISSDVNRQAQVAFAFGGLQLSPALQGRAAGSKIKTARSIGTATRLFFRDSHLARNIFDG